MLKPHVARTSESDPSASAKILPVAVTTVLPAYSPQDNDLEIQDAPTLYARLKNSQVWCELETHLSHLSGTAKRDVITLIESHLEIFSDVPTKTHIVQHDINAGDCPPIKQHAYHVDNNKGSNEGGG